MKPRPQTLHYIKFNKPYGVLSQFTRESGHRSLGDFGPFPRDVYAAGRLDVDSEGLLLLTNDGELKHFLNDPEFGHRRTYLAQVEGIPAEEAIARLRTGITLDRARTRPATVRLLASEPVLFPRAVPIRYRKTVPTSWLELTLREGRNRQVRRMTAAVGHPTLRLVRIRLGPLSLADLSPGECRPLTPGELRELTAGLRR